MPNKPELHKSQRSKVKQLESRGFAVICDDGIGIQMGLVDDSGYKQRVTVTRQGKLLRYRAIKARKIDRQKLPKLKVPLEELSTVNFV